MKIEVSSNLIKNIKDYWKKEQKLASKKTTVKKEWVVNFLNNIIEIIDGEQK